MANTVISYDEVRIITKDPQLTHVYVYISNLSGDGMLNVQGWHYKTFPARLSATDILIAWRDGKEDPLMWPLNSPDNN